MPGLPRAASASRPGLPAVHILALVSTAGRPLLLTHRARGLAASGPAAKGSGRTGPSASGGGLRRVRLWELLRNVECPGLPLDRYEQFGIRLRHLPEDGASPVQLAGKANRHEEGPDPFRTPPPALPQDLVSELVDMTIALNALPARFAGSLGRQRGSGKRQRGLDLRGLEVLLRRQLSCLLEVTQGFGDVPVKARVTVHSPSGHGRCVQTQQPRRSRASPTRPAPGARGGLLDLSPNAAFRLGRPGAELHSRGEAQLGKWCGGATASGSIPDRPGRPVPGGPRPPKCHPCSSRPPEAAKSMTNASCPAPRSTTRALDIPHGALVIATVSRWPPARLNGRKRPCAPPGPGRPRTAPPAAASARRSTTGASRAPPRPAPASGCRGRGSWAWVSRTTPSAPASLTSRARRRAVASPPKCTPGEETDSIAVSIPHRSITSRCAAADQEDKAGTPSDAVWPAVCAWRMEEAVTKWACTSAKPTVPSGAKTDSSSEGAASGVAEDGRYAGVSCQSATGGRAGRSRRTAGGR